MRSARRGAIPAGLTHPAPFCQLVRNMSITIQLDLPEALAAKARAKGLLDPVLLAQLIAREVAESEDNRNFFEIAREIRSVPGEPMTLEEIQKIVDEVRVERATREARR